MLQFFWLLFCSLGIQACAQLRVLPLLSLYLEHFPSRYPYDLLHYFLKISVKNVTFTVRSFIIKKFRIIALYLNLLKRSIPFSSYLSIFSCCYLTYCLTISFLFGFLSPQQHFLNRLFDFNHEFIL